MDPLETIDLFVYSTVDNNWKLASKGVLLRHNEGWGLVVNNLSSAILPPFLIERSNHVSMPSQVCIVSNLFHGDDDSFAPMLRE